MGPSNFAPIAQALTDLFVFQPYPNAVLKRQLTSRGSAQLTR